MVHYTYHKISSEKINPTHTSIKALSRQWIWKSSNIWMESNNEKIYESITIRWFWMDDRNPGGKVKRRDSKLDPNEICVLNIGNDKQISFKRIEFKIKISKWISIWYILNDVNSLFFFNFFLFPGSEYALPF